MIGKTSRTNHIIYALEHTVKEPEGQLQQKEYNQINWS